MDHIPYEVRLLFSMMIQRLSCKECNFFFKMLQASYDLFVAISVEDVGTRMISSQIASRMHQTASESVSRSPGTAC